MKHVVNLVVSQPDHDFISMRGRKQEKTCIQEANTPEEAMNRATRRMKNLGFYVHGASIVEQKAPEAPAAKPLTEGVAEVQAAQEKRKAAMKKATAEVDKSEVQDKAGKAQAGSALATYLKNKASTMKEEVEVTSGYLEEKLSAADPASKWIHDFVASDNPKFEGKSKAERIKMALGAKYAADRAVKEDVELEEGRAMDYKMSRSSVAGDRGDSKGGEINVSQKDREEIAKILGAKDDKKQDKKLEEAEQVEEGVKNDPNFPRVHTSWFVKPAKGSRTFGKEFRMADKDKAEAYAMEIGGSVHKMDQYGSTMKEEVEQVEEAKADPVTKAKELLDQAEKGTYKGSAKALQAALEKAKSRNFDQGKGYKLEEDAEQLDETGVVKKTNKTLKNIMAASKGAKINAAMGDAKMDPADYGYNSPQHLNKAIGRMVSRGAQFAEETLERTIPKSNPSKFQLPGYPTPKPDRSQLPGYPTPKPDRSQLPGYPTPKPDRSQLPGYPTPKPKEKGSMDLVRPSPKPSDKGPAYIEEGEGTTPTTPKEKELAAKAGDPNKITKKDVLAARGVKLDESKMKDIATKRAEDKRLAAAQKALDAAKKTRKTVVGGDKAHKVNTSPTTGDSSASLGVGGK